MGRRRAAVQNPSNVGARLGGHEPTSTASPCALKLKRVETNMVDNDSLAKDNS